MIPLRPKLQNYAWGKIGSNSTVAALSKETGVEIDEKKPYAELWMGTHVNGPSEVFINGKYRPLLDHIGHKLPFLFKVLSVNSALSIQAHPGKVLAKELHAKFPAIYKDDNHKPEMALALTDFQALCGFQSLDSILFNIESNPELKMLLPDLKDSSFVDIEADSERLKFLFSSLMKLKNQELIEKALKLLCNRLESKKSEELSLENKLVLRLSDEYPNDIGIFCVFFLNYVVLKPFEAIFLDASVPHAYLQGDCAEIMASSDNVVRAGLTPKYRDVETLLKMLRYDEDKEGQGFRVKGMEEDENVTTFEPLSREVDEFSLQLVKVTAIQKEEMRLKKSKESSIILILQGECSFSYVKDQRSIVEAEKGSVFFVEQDLDLCIKTTSKQDLLLLRASTRTSF